MHIMEIISTAGVNGAVIHGTMIARELARRGHHITLVCLPESFCSKQMGQEPVRIVESSLRRWPLDQIMRFAQIVLGESIDVIHTHLSRANFFGLTLSWVTGVPCVATAHNHCIQLNWMFHSGVIAVSRATSRFQKTYNLVCPSRLHIIHNFLDPHRFSDVPTQAALHVRSEFGIEEKNPVIGIVGDVVPRKGLIYLVTALKEIRNVIPDVRLLVVGSGPSSYVGKVKVRAELTGVSSCILWAGHREDIPEILKSLDLFVLPSRNEPFGLAVLEAMASGLPVVATSVGGLQECVVANVTGFLVQPSNPRVLAKAVISLLQDKQLRHRFGEAGRKRVCNHFSAENQVPKIESVLARVAKDRKKGFFHLLRF